LQENSWASVPDILACLATLVETGGQLHSISCNSLGEDLAAVVSLHNLANIAFFLKKYYLHTKKSRFS
jgi:hypothetical protein